jgi:putative molybdopterin biosynthesis protein
MLTPAEVARLVAISRKTVYREIERGELPAIHVGRQLRIDPTDLNRYFGRMP